MKVQKLLKTCAMCSGQLIAGEIIKQRQYYKCKQCGCTVDAKIKWETKKK